MTTQTITPQGPAPSLSGTLAKDLKTVVGDTGALLKEAGCSALKEIAATRTAVGDKARGLADATDRLARNKPWTMVGLAATAGLIVGALLGRR